MSVRQRSISYDFAGLGAGPHPPVGAFAPVGLVLHARTAYEDYAGPGRQRHLLRTWIAVSDARRRPLAESLAGRYRLVLQGGIPRKDEG